jgi:hypothetical protein
MLVQATSLLIHLPRAPMDMGRTRRPAGSAWL